MASVHSRDTKPELIVRKFLHANGFRYSINAKKITGSPDIVLNKYHIVIFVHGCFWHGHNNCKYATLPATNREFWKKKIETNKQRDLSVVAELKKTGWVVITIWTCKLSNLTKINRTLNSLLTKVENVALGQSHPSKLLTSKTSGSNKSRIESPPKIKERGGLKNKKKDRRRRKNEIW